MKDENKTKEQLIGELAELRLRVAELEASGTYRKRAEEDLQSGGHRFRLFYDNQPNYCYMISPEGTVLNANRSALKALGYEKEELVGKPLHAIYAPESLPKMRQLFKRWKETGSLTDEEITIITKDGNRRTVLLSTDAVRNEQGDILHSISVQTDITERKRMERQIRDYSENLERMVRERTRSLEDAQAELVASEEKHRSILQQASDAIVFFDAEFVVREWNRQAEELFGYKEQEVVGRRWTEFLPPRESPEGRHASQQLEESATELERQGFVCSQEVTSYVRKDRKPFHVEVSVAWVKDREGKPSGYSAIYRDISERKRLEKELADSEERYRAIFEHAGDAIVVLDTTGVVQAYNWQAQQMFGYKAKEVMGRLWQSLHPPARSPAGRHAQQQMEERKQMLMAQGFYRSGDAVSYSRKDGKPFPVETSGAVLRDGQGNTMGYSVIFRDISQRKWLEKDKERYARNLEAKIKEVETARNELQEAQEKLVRTEKLAAIGELAGGVGHELRNPLGAIKNVAYLLNLILTEPEPGVKESLEILEKEVATSERIISSLLDFGRPKSPARETVSIYDVARAALFDVKVPAKVEVVSQLDESLPAIVADGHQLGRVFENIITNAIQAMPEGGKLVIKSEVLSPAWLAVSFADTGVGIPKENLEKLFEPLFTTRSTGVGLGLAVVKTLVERQDGAIEVESEVGKGTAFTVKLPVAGAS